jgi:GR25 family glycosyltransferase involved in LPS biosynthesis
MKFEVSYMLGADKMERRHLVAQQFSSFLSADWSLRFIENMSHVDAVTRIVENDGYVMIAEDGVEFTRRTEELVRRCVDALIGRPWQVAFTEMKFMNPDEAAKLFPPFEEMIHNNSLQMHGLAGVPISGLRCYVINKWAKHQFLEQISTHDPATESFDQFLARGCMIRAINAFAIYPFPTSIAQYPKLERKPESVQPAPAPAPVLGQLAKTLAWIEGH